MRQHWLSSCFFLFLLLSTDVAIAELNPLLQASSKHNSVKIEKVISVDTFLISGDTRVMMIGIQGPKAPPRHYAERDSHGFIIPDNDPTTPFGEEALRYVRELMEGKVVRLEFDVERRNDDNILQAYVFLSDGRMANLEILRSGYAQLKLRSPNLKYTDKFRAAYQEARSQMRGLQGQW